MAAPIANKIQTPDDSGNVGKKIRTQTRIIGADTVHEHFFIPISQYAKTGFYRAHSGILTIPTAAHNGTTTGHLWFQNPVAGTRIARLRRLRETLQVIAGAIDLTAPRQLFSVFTFTGTASGAVLTPMRRDYSLDAAPTCDIRTAVTGMTPSLVATFRHTGVPPIVATASSATVQTMLPPSIYPPWDPDEEECAIIRPGQGVILWSADASTTANRRLFSDWAWEEFEP